MEMITVRNDVSRFPFTSSQWQELEHQALVYRYIISGIPIPSHLLFSIKTSLVDSSSSKQLFPHPPHHSIGWEYLQQMGFGRKIDPEPGRCRRTDGKKWRCSKEAYLDSKYCERHMHRGRNRSRKPVETNLSTPNTPPPPSSSICTKLMKLRSPDSHPPFVHPQLSSSRSPAAAANVLSSQDRFLLESNSRTYSHSEKDRRDIISSSVGDSWLFEPLAVNNSSSLTHSNQQSFSDHQNNDSYSRLQYLKTEGKDEEAHKVMHHFFDESPDNGTDNDNDNDDHNKHTDSSTTQLSISIPNQDK